MQNKEKRGVFCDLGDTAMLLRIPQVLKALQQRSAWKEQEGFLKAVQLAHDDGVFNEFQCGRISPQAFSIVCRDYLRIPLSRMSETEFWNCYTNIVEKINFPLIKNLRDMRARGLTLVLISNIDPEHWSLIWRKYRVDLGLNVFHYRVLSCDPDVQSCKPEQKIFNCGFDKASVIPSLVYFVDDKQINISGGIRAGIPEDQTLLYRADLHDEEAIPFFRRHGLIT